MASYTDPPDEGRGRRDFTVALGALLLSVLVLFLPTGTQLRIADGLTASVLRPFVLTQELVAEARLRAEDALRLHSQLDSLSSIVAGQASLAEENRQLRSLLELSQRAPDLFVAANLIRPGTPGSESTFLLDAGSDRGIRRGAPVLMRSGRLGLLGVVREVTPTGSVGLDWSHPDFKASAMTASDSTFGLVERREGEFRGGERLLLNAVPYYEPLDSGTLIVTSGLGGVFPRGIPIGEVLEVHQEEGRWRKEYWLRPVVDPGSVTHVLVLKGNPESEELIRLFQEVQGPVDPPRDSAGGPGG